MPISRGYIRHTLTEDLLNFGRSIFKPSIFLRASDAQKTKLSSKICNKFDYENIVLFPYARSAFHAILKEINLPKNSTILLTPITIGPMLEVIIALGHKPLFVDIELKTFCVNLDDLKKKLETKPSCFLMTYLFGYVPEIKSITKLCKDAKVTLIEDISHNIGSLYCGRPLGSFGDFAIYSASMLKYVDGYNGAFVSTKDKSFAKRLDLEVSKYRDPDPIRIAKIIRTTLLWNFCLRRIPFSFFVYPLLWLIKRFNREKFEQILGARIKFKSVDKLPRYYFEDISSIQCETISEQLDKLDNLINSRIQNSLTVAKVGKHVLGHELIPNYSECSKIYHHTFWQFVVYVKDTYRTRDALFRIGIETGTTNLMNLASEVGIEMPMATILKNHYIFVPVQKNSQKSIYAKFFSILKKTLN